jgi:hypothetical protein
MQLTDPELFIITFVHVLFRAPLLMLPPRSGTNLGNDLKLDLPLWPRQEKKLTFLSGFFFFCVCIFMLDLEPHSGLKNLRRPEIMIAIGGGGFFPARVLVG